MDKAEIALSLLKIGWLPSPLDEPDRFLYRKLRLSYLAGRDITDSENKALRLLVKKYLCL